MTTNGRFVTQLAGATSLGLLLASYPVWRFFGDRALLGVVLGAVVSAANCAGGYYFLRFAMGRSATLETAALLGGFLVRLVVAIGILFLLRGVEAIDVVAMALSLVGFYFLTMIVEVRFLFRNVLRLRPAIGGVSGRRDA